MENIIRIVIGNTKLASTILIRNPSHLGYQTCYLQSCLFGPVLMSVREEYRNATPYSNVVQAVDDFTSSLLEKVLARYAERSSWSLSRLSHDEVSWKHAREGLNPEDNGNVPLTEKMMRVDAVREKAQRKYSKKA